jgi:preprotein translocase subunit YajC
MDLFFSTAWAQEAGAPAAGAQPMIFSLLPFILIFVIFYFLLIVPQQRQRKKHRQMLDGLKKGDRVVTSSGFLGTVANIHKDVVTLQLGDNLKVKVKKEFVSEIQSGEDEG